MADPDVLARAYLDTLRKHTFTPPDGFDPRTLTLRQSYDVQDRVLAIRESRGETLAGYKVGCTSAAIRSQFGLTEPISGRLYRTEVHADGARLAWNDYVELAVEPELALCLSGGGDVGWITAAIEIHNYRFWSGRPSSQELVMSNGIHAGVVIGRARVSPGGLDLGGVRIELRIDGETKAVGWGRDIMEGPMSSLNWLKNHLASRGLALRSGHLVIPGSPVKLVSVPRGAVVETLIDGVASARATFD